MYIKGDVYMKKLWPIIFGVIGFIATIAITAIVIFKLFFDTPTVNCNEFKNHTISQKDKYVINMPLNDNRTTSNCNIIEILEENKNIY